MQDTLSLHSKRDKLVHYAGVTGIVCRTYIGS